MSCHVPTTNHQYSHICSISLLQDVLALKDLLTAASEPGPYTVAGHSVGGQTALQFGGLFPAATSGIFMMDSYSEAAIGFAMNYTKQVTLPNGTTITLPAMFTAPPSILDITRAVTPLAWARFITGTSSKGGPGFIYGPQMAAAYGNNKEWHSQWVEVLSMAAGMSSADDVTTIAGRKVWQGVGWPSFGSKPVLLPPASNTLALPAGCASSFATNVTCRTSTLADPMQWYAKVYLAYKDTLSSNTTLVITGEHSFVWDKPQAAVTEMLAKFAGV